MELREGYKQTEVGVIPEDWEVKELSELGSFKNGINKNKEAFGHGFPLVNLMDVFGVTSISSTEILGLIDSTDFERSTYSVKEDDVLFIRSSVKPSGVGLTAVVQNDLQESVFSGFLIRFRDGGFIDKGFKKHCFFDKGFRKRVIEASTVSANTNINQDSLKRLQLPLPPTKAEQEAIAGALSDVDALISSLESLITKKRHIKQGAMQELLTGKKRLPEFDEVWGEKSFDEIFNFYPTATNSRSDLCVEGDAYYIHYGDIHTKFHSHLNFETDKPPMIDRHLCKNAALLQNGDWVMADASEDYDGVGKTIEISGLEDGMPAVAGLHTFLLREKANTFESGFKGHLGNLKSLHDQMLRVATGLKVYGVSKTALKDLMLPVPEPDEQTAIASILSDMDAEITELERKLGKTSLLKQGMMAELLTGSIRLVQLAGEKKGKTENAVEPKQNWAFREAVVIAVLAGQFGEQGFPLGRKRYTKLSYLLHRKADQNTQGYLKKAAGPYNPKTKYAGPEAIAQKKNYMKRHKEGRYSGFIAAAKIDEAQSYFEKWYGDKMQKWLEQFHYTSNDDLEVIATVDMAMQEIKKLGEEPDLKKVRRYIASEPEWKNKLKRKEFSDANVQAAILECQQMFSGGEVG